MLLRKLTTLMKIKYSLVRYRSTPALPIAVANQSLSYYSPAIPPFNRQVTLQIKCNDTNNWAQYVHVRVTETAPVVVGANVNLARGE